MILSRAAQLFLWKNMEIGILISKRWIGVLENVVLLKKNKNSKL